jgi:hypothetical protein
MKVSVEYAAGHFEDLVSAVYNGYEVEIECAGHPPLRLLILMTTGPSFYQRSSGPTGKNPTVDARARRTWGIREAF